MADKEKNMVTLFIWWLIMLPFKIVFTLIAGFLTIFMYYLTKIEDLGGKEESLRYIKDNLIVPELRNELPAILTPAQYEYAYNHFVTFIVDIFSNIIDEVFVAFGTDPSTLQLATLIAMSTAFRTSAAIFVYATAVVFFFSAMLYGRYKFHLEWKKSKVVEVSSTKFAIGWQSKVILPMITFIYIASPYPFYQGYAYFICGWAAIVGYHLARSFTDHL